MRQEPYWVQEEGLRLKSEKILGDGRNWVLDGEIPAGSLGRYFKDGFGWKLKYSLGVW